MILWTHHTGYIECGQKFVYNTKEKLKLFSRVVRDHTQIIPNLGSSPVHVVPRESLNVIVEILRNTTTCRVISITSIKQNCIPLFIFVICAISGCIQAFRIYSWLFSKIVLRNDWDTIWDTEDWTLVTACKCPTLYMIFLPHALYPLELSHVSWESPPWPPSWSPLGSSTPILKTLPKCYNKKSINKILASSKIK